MDPESTNEDEIKMKEMTSDFIKSIHHTMKNQEQTKELLYKHGNEFIKHIHENGKTIVIDSFLHSLIDTLKLTFDSMDVASSQDGSASSIVEIIHQLNPKSILYILHGVIDSCCSISIISFATYKNLGDYMLQQSYTTISNNKEEYLKMFISFLKLNATSTNPLECIRYRQHISKQSIRHIIEYNDTEENKMYTLIRAQRSLCFDLLLDSVKGYAFDIHTMNIQTDQYDQELVSFIIFICNCIQGESDPRCLLQSLKLLSSCQEYLRPLFYNKTSYPYQQVYNTISCYYPIDFTPPPNDKHGITKQQLQDNLRDILCWDDGTDMNVKYLVIKLFLDRLDECCNDDDKDSTIQEPINDIVCFLKGNTLQRVQSDDKTILVEISQSLFKIHSKVIANKSNKQVMKVIRDLSCTILSRIHEQCKEVYLDSIWNVLDDDILSESYLINIAYISSIAITDCDMFTTCIDHILPSILSIDLTTKTKDETHKIQMRRLEIISLFLNAAWSLLNKDEIPSSHPMEKYISIIWNIISSCLKEMLVIQPQSKSDETCNTIDKNRMKVLLQTLQSFIVVLVPSYQDQIVPSNIRIDIIQTMSNLIQHLMSNETHSTTSDNPSNEIDRRYSAKILGAVLSSIQEESFLYPYVLDWITLLLENSTSNTDNMAGSAYFSYIGIQILAQSCQSNSTICQKVITYYTSILLSNDNDLQNKILVANHFASIMLYTDNNTCNNTKSVIPQSIWNSMVVEFTKDIISSLLSSFTTKVDVSMMDNRQLLLPATYQQMKEKADDELQLSLNLLKSLVPTYQRISDEESIQQLQFYLFSNLAKCTPPLSYADSISNYLVMIVLAAVLSTSSTLLDRNNSKIDMIQLLPSFIEHALSTTEESVATRSSAASCLYSICILIQSKDGVNINDFMNVVTLDQYLFPILEMVVANSNESDFLVKMEDILNLIGLVGSTTLYHIGSNSIDRIVKLFVRFACSTMSTSDENDDYSGTPSAINYNDIPSSISVLSAKAFGSMISSPISNHNTNFKASPFWKQRACYTALPFLLRLVKNETSNIHDKNTIAIDLILAHLGCCIPILALGEDNISIVLQRITHRLGNAHELMDCYGMDEFATIALAALVKFLSLSSSDVVASHVPKIIQALLQFLTYSYHKITIPQILLALQCLMDVTNVMNGSYHQFQLLVIQCLKKSLDHPCRTVRISSVSVLNHWSVI